VLSRLFILPTLLLLIAEMAIAQQQPVRIDIKLTNVRWQFVRREVHSVCVGPDGRTWYQLNPELPGWSLAEIKSRLQREWKEASPQISGVQLALLEPGGRAWFLTDFNRLLLGYDGKTWVEYRGTSKPANFGGGSPSQGSFLSNRSCRYAGNRAWFCASGGIHTFDGREWTVQEFEEAVGRPTSAPAFAVSPDGKIAVAVYGKDSSCWAYRDSKWNRLAPLGNGSIPFGGNCFVTNQGIVWYRYRGGIGSYSLLEAKESAPDKTGEVVAALIKQLGNEDFARREEASKKLEEFGPAIRPRLEAALMAAEDVEIKLRLKKLVGKPVRAPEPKLPIVATIGKYQVSEVKHLGQDDQGTLYIAAAAIQSEDSKPAPGLLMIDAAGKATLLANPAGMETWWRKGDDLQREVFLVGNRGLWFNPLPGASPHACLDLKANKIVAELPELRVGPVVAVDKEGRAFTSGFHFAGSPSVMAYTLDAPEIRPSLPEMKFPIVPTSDPFTALDGSIWAERKFNGLSRFDGKDWTAVDPGEVDKLTPATSGEEGVVLYEGARKVFGGKGNHYLFQRDKLLGKGNLRNLVKEHRALLAKAFASSRSSQYLPRIVIAADKGENIWLLEENNKVAVLAGDGWLDGAESIKAALMAPFGDNSRAYFSLSASPAKSQIGEVRDGKLLFVDAPHMTPSDGLPYSLREPTGELWLPANKSMYVTNVGVFDQMSLRLGQNGQAQEIQGSGLPMLVDESGIVWLGRIFSQPQNKFALWRGGKIVQRLEIPETDGVRTLLSDKPGSVYAFSAIGLTHLMADGEGRYRVDKTYALPPLPNSQKTMHSRLGYLVTKTYTDSPREVQLLLVSLPRE
jgi:hypothetical protein